MTALIDQGIFGIIVGIFTSAILFAFKVFWSEKFTPFLVGLRYQGVEIDGQWSGVSEVTQEDIKENRDEGPVFRHESNLFLTQNAHNLSGSFVSKFKNEEKDFSLNFDVTGYMWEGYITLNFTLQDKKVTAYGTALLKIDGGGINLVGSWLFRDVIKENVSQVFLILTRDNQS